MDRLEGRDVLAGVGRSGGGGHERQRPAKHKRYRQYQRENGLIMPPTTGATLSPVAPLLSVQLIDPGRDDGVVGSIGGAIVFPAELAKRT